jgi:hypothetical protein
MPQIMALVDAGGENLNSLFEGLTDWEAQLKPLFPEIFEELEGLE